MVHLKIFEDSPADLTRRYYAIACDPRHRVTVYALGDLAQEMMAQRGAYMEYEQGGFEIPLHLHDSADLYFTDGLNGRWREVMAIAPRDKLYLVSGDGSIIEEGIAEGIQTIKTPLEIKKIAQAVRDFEKQ